MSNFESNEIIFLYFEHLERHEFQAKQLEPVSKIFLGKITYKWCI